MPTTTPSGWRSVWQSMPRAIFSNDSPISKEGMPQANSTTSIPRLRSPRASDSVLPCSVEMPRQSSSKASSNKIFTRNSTWARSFGGVSRHIGKAALAAATTSFTSAGPHIGTVAMTLPRDGLKTWLLPLPATSFHFPPTYKGQLASTDALMSGGIRTEPSGQGRRTASRSHRRPIPRRSSPW